MDKQLDILLVEDDPNLGPVIEKALASSGHRVTHVSSIDDAFDSFAANRNYNVVLLDLQVGDERGESLIEKLLIDGKKIPPVIVMSAQPTYEISSSARWINASTVLTKPCRIEDIESAIQRVAA